jgi:outer membrane protein assembly factor BamE
MRVPFFRNERVRVPLAGLSLALLAILSGCASKNPLMEEPGARAAVPPAQTQGQAQAAAEPAKVPEAGITATGPKGLRRILGSFSPYRIDVRQGNFVSSEMVAQLKEGMTPEQVRFVLGTPLLTDLFHANRWDYVFRLQKGSGAVIASRVTVFFENARVARIESDDLPTEAEYLAFIAGK